MITTTALALALALQVLTAPPARAASFAECEAFLCLPGGFPPWECNAAKAAVISRLNRLLPSLPSWSSCASAWGWDSAFLGNQDRWYDECPQGGTPDAYGIDATICEGDLGECTFIYSAQKKVTATSVIDGSSSFSPNTPFTHVARAAGEMDLTCPEPPIIDTGGDGVPPIVGPPASTGGFGSTGYN